MSYRFMRMIVFFDLPTETAADRREYRKFRKMLIKNGFLMMQESVYCRLLLNQTMQISVQNTIRKNKPPGGIVQSLVITEKQFAGMEYIVGESKTDVINSDERLVIL